MQLGKHVARF